MKAKKKLYLFDRRTKLIVDLAILKELKESELHYWSEYQQAILNYVEEEIDGIEYTLNLGK